MDRDEQATMAMKCIVQMQPVYERCRELVELADSAPNLTLAVVDETSGRDVYQHGNGVDGYVAAYNYRRVVKMEGD